MNKVLVTGCCGLIGSHLSEKLSDYYQVVGIDNFSRGSDSERIYNEIRPKMYKVYRKNINEFREMKEIIAEEKPDLIFHLAALISHRTALERPYDYLETDFMGTVNLLESARLAGNHPVFFFASSNKVYGNQPGPWKEDMNLAPEGPYALGKLSAEEACKMYDKYLGVRCVAGRYHHVIGDRTSDDLVTALFVRQALAGEELQVHGEFDKNGEFISCSANYTHVDDVVRATIMAAEKYHEFDVFNIGNSKTSVILEMAKMIVNKTGSHAKIACVKKPVHESLHNESDFSKAEKALGFKPEIPVEKGIEDYLAWKIKYV